MSGFKLLAIRPLKDCNPKFLKVLTAGEIYQFYNDYNFLRRDEDRIHSDVKEINYTSSIPEDLFSIKWDMGEGEKDQILPIHLSAIVGENGSGKSTLMELLFTAIYNLSVTSKILKYNKDLEEGDLTKDQKKAVKEEDKCIKLIPNIKVELFFELNSKKICLKIDSDETSFLKDLQSEVYTYNILPPVEKLDAREFDLGKLVEEAKQFIKTHFFYTIALNHSAYALNSKQLGSWIDYVVHKNDGYQTPLVINPKRTKGNIDINIENDLVKQRLMSNILEPIGKLKPKDSLRNFAPNKTCTGIELKLNHHKIINKKEKIDTSIFPLEFANCIASIFQGYTNKSYSDIDDKGKEFATEYYIINKLKKICIKYDRYNDFLVDNEFVDIPSFVRLFCKDKSHITFKLKQALNFLLYYHIPNVKSKGSFLIPINDLEASIIKVKEQVANEGRDAISTIELIPPSFFKSRIKFNEIGYFDEFSSGEKQKVHSISTIIYHLMNINSVFDNGDNTTDDFLQYSYVNILFDEVELYFHPDLQRNFVNDFLLYIQKINPILVTKIEGINVCFATHSPFILSDIPNSNVLYLKTKGMPPKAYQDHEMNSKTFGANIHNLLHSEFFMKDGFMGEFSKKKINETISYLNKVKLEKNQTKITAELESYKGNLTKENVEDQEILNKKLEQIKMKIALLSHSDINRSPKDYRQIIDIIGEPILEKKLIAMHQELFGISDGDQKSKSEQLHKLADELNYDITKKE